MVLITVEVCAMVLRDDASSCIAFSSYGAIQQSLLRSSGAWGILSASIAVTKWTLVSFVVPHGMRAGRTHETAVTIKAFVSQLSGRRVQDWRSTPWICFDLMVDPCRTCVHLDCEILLLKLVFGQERIYNRTSSFFMRHCTLDIKSSTDIWAFNKLDNESHR